MWQEALQAMTEYQQKGNITIFPLSEVAYQDRMELTALFEALPQLDRVYNEIFSQSRPLRLQWRSFVACQGAVVHPFSTKDNKPDFQGTLWANSILSFEQCPLNVKMEYGQEHPLPCFETLLGCMDKHRMSTSAASRFEGQHLFMFREDKIQLVAMAMGSKVLRLVSQGHIDRLYPALAFHEGNYFSQEDCSTVAVKLGLLLMLGRNFETYTSTAKFWENETRALKNMFTVPFRKAEDVNLQAAFFAKHPPSQRPEFLPFVLGALSMKEYDAYRSNPDEWIVSKERFLAPLEGLSQVVLQAKERLRLAKKDRKRSPSAEARPSKASRTDKRGVQAKTVPLPLSMTSQEYSG